MMKNLRFIICSLLLFGLGLTGLHAQEAVSAAGGDASGSGGTMSFTAGQVACQTYTGTTGSIAEGVQQTYVITVATSTEATKGINLSVSAYPNPTSDFLLLEIKDLELAKLSFQLFDASGKILQNNNIIEDKTSIKMGNLTPAIYFIKVLQNNEEIKIFKVIKK